MLALTPALLSLSNVLVCRLILDMYISWSTILEIPDGEKTTNNHFGQMMSKMLSNVTFCCSEIATRGPHGLESDVWSLGCMLYTLLVGQPPFDVSTDCI